ncbi:MAG: type II toxin-antitoxin system RelE/ParE family toxin [Chloroflexi bacterium]|nr:type II toxin-antitoxin system RelE/ParE family toxin [Chloroflexota bacterium]
MASKSDYALTILPAAQKDIRTLPPKIRGQVVRAIDRLLESYRTGRRPQDMKPVEGRDHAYRIDSGEYRILYEDHAGRDELVVFRVRHRRDAYRNL